MANRKESITIHVSEKDKKTVLLKVVYLKVGEVDTVKEQFIADICLRARWREPALDGVKSNSHVDFKKYWNPKIHVSNLIGESQQSIWTELGLVPSGEAYIVEKRRISGTFGERMELQDFPFDFQDLSIIVCTELPETVAELVEDDYEVSIVNVQCFVDEQEWKLHDFVDSEKREVSKDFTDVKFRNPGLIMRTVAERRAGFFIWNILVIMMLISTLSFTTFAVDTALPQNRLQLSFIITLTSVTFRFVTNQSLPKIPYLTNLDKYILGSMIFNWLVTIWHGVVSRFAYSRNLETMLDWWAFMSFVILYGTLQAYFFLMVLIKYLMRRNMVKDREALYLERAQKVMGLTWKSSKASLTSRRNKRKIAASNGKI
ncbi:hypothetical protein CHS0354_020877 [Potamilus streckersoni]|uniref:Neurotransmitter-gated ion-channel ligand-binding domain-containing protein n=1 Tax=Potamilus streckersoni TaxID=2493646 RepID=A0AAE0SF55_9BIVA|nr:hypothetical protein CHS0354_020877 [Potamilus streckersoni]